MCCCMPSNARVFWAHTSPTVVDKPRCATNLVNNQPVLVGLIALRVPIHVIMLVDVPPICHPHRYISSKGFPWFLCIHQGGWVVLRIVSCRRWHFYVAAADVFNLCTAGLQVPVVLPRRPIEVRPVRNWVGTVYCGLAGDACRGAAHMHGGGDPHQLCLRVEDIIVTIHLPGNKYNKQHITKCKAKQKQWTNEQLNTFEQK